MVDDVFVDHRAPQFLVAQGDDDDEDVTDDKAVAKKKATIGKTKDSGVFTNSSGGRMSLSTASIVKCTGRSVFEQKTTQLHAFNSFLI